MSFLGWPWVNFVMLVVLKIMQITADVRKISKTVLCDLTFISNVLSGFSIHFFLIFNSSC